MNNNLQLVATRNFDGITFNCYVDPAQEDKSDFLATREQIGQLLGYADPTKAIGNLHERNKERLDYFSTILNLRKVEGGREISREVIVYNFKGLLEICRYSNQPNAHKVIDVLWDIADEIRRTGSYSVKMSAEERELKLREFDLKEKELDLRSKELDLQAAQAIQDMIDNPPFPLTDETRTVFGQEVFKLRSGHEYLAMLPESTEKWYSASDIAKILGTSANKVGRVAKKYGLKAPEGETNEYGRWVFSKSRHSNHECSTFIYNAHALERFKQLFGQSNQLSF